jgi:hypothetical protein
MTDAQELLRAFMHEWGAGLRPDVDAFLAEAPAPQQCELADAIHAFLCSAPSPRYDEQTLAELESSQPVREAARAIDGRTGTWPLLLPSLRRQRRLTRAEVAQRLAGELGFSSAHDRVRRHLHNMEYGTADALCVSDRVLIALARVLGTTFSDLARAGRVPTLGGPTSRLAPTRRGFPDPPPFSEVPVDYRQPDTSDQSEWAAVDRLFLRASDE